MPKREVVQVYENREQSEGEGARVRRSIGNRELRNLDPFLMLDEFYGDGKNGFPDHPHRGFETVTYVLEGAVSHEDFKGNKGVIGPGDLQWMTAGRGIVHSEMPQDDGSGSKRHRGLQLWINLAKQYKMIEPKYQELRDAQIPKKSENGVHVKIIAGEAMGVKSPVYTLTPTAYLDFKLDKNAQFTQPIPSDWNAFAFVLEGTCVFGTDKPTEVKAHHTVVFNKGDSITFRNNRDEQLHMVLIYGKPLNEPVVQHGPFVMNTQEEIQQTFHDYQFGKNGFENAPKWVSEELKRRQRRY